MVEKPVVHLTASKEAVLIPVRLTPRGRKNGITGVREGALLISVTAPPVHGAANAALLEVLHAVLDCPKNCLTLRRGEKSRDKVVAVTGVELEEVRARLFK